MRPEIVLPNGVRALEIPLTRNLSTFVSPEDYDIIKKFAWHAHKTDWTYYARTFHTYMHRMLLAPPRNRIIHHKDGNGLNNTRENIIVATQGLNAAQAKLRSTKRTSRFRGVSRHEGGKWAAELTIDYRKHYLGLFLTEEAAAEAYNRASLRLRGADYPINDLSISNG